MVPQNPAPVRMLRLWAPVLIVALSCAGLQALGWDTAWRYERHLIADGQWWRLLSGHFVHLGWRHWGLNIAGLVLIVGLFTESLHGRRFAVGLSVCALATGLGLYAFSPTVGWYVGLSGALHGLFIVGLLSQWREQPGLSWLILAVLTAKLVYEHLFGALPGSEATAGGPVVVAAHSYGAVGGVVYWTVAWGLRYARTRKKEKGER